MNKKQLMKFLLVAAIPIIVWSLPAPQGLKKET